MSCELPKVYQERWAHDDWAIRGVPRWLQPWSYIPRRWTGHCFAMPPALLMGTMSERPIEVQDGYPLAPDAAVWRDKYGTKYVMGSDPVGPTPSWGILGVYCKPLDRYIPCYFTVCRMLFGRRFHFNGGPLAPVLPLVVAAALFLGAGWWTFLALLLLIGCKPDVTKGDWFWWFEFSLTWTKPK